MNFTGGRLRIDWRELFEMMAFYNFSFRLPRIHAWHHDQVVNRMCHKRLFWKTQRANNSLHENQLLCRHRAYTVVIWNLKMCIRRKHPVRLICLKKPWLYENTRKTISIQFLIYWHAFIHQFIHSNSITINLFYVSYLLLLLFIILLVYY